jgi:hypothetical protein
VRINHPLICRTSVTNYVTTPVRACTATDVYRPHIARDLRVQPGLGNLSVARDEETGSHFNQPTPRKIILA